MVEIKKKKTSERSKRTNKIIKTISIENKILNKENISISTI